MKVFLAVFLCMVLLTLAPSTSAQGDAQTYYSRRYDNIDVNTIFRSSRLLNNYVDCLLDKKPCPPEGKDLKRVLPDALKTRCERCTKLQKSKALDVITKLYYQHPAMYTALAERYDPTGEYTRNFENWFDEQNAVKPRPPIPQDQPPRQTTRTTAAPTPPVPTERTRIPSTWITSSTTTTTPRPAPTRPTLRTLPPTVRTTTQTLPTQPVFRELPSTPQVEITVPRTTTTTQQPATTERTTTQQLATFPTTLKTPPPTAQSFEPPATFRVPVTVFIPPPAPSTIRTSTFLNRVDDPTIFQTPPLTIRTQPPLRTEAPTFRTQPSTFRTEPTVARTFRPDPTVPRVQPTFRPDPPIIRTQPPFRPEPPVIRTQPATVRTPASPPRDSTVVFRPPATVRTPSRGIQSDFQPSSVIDNFFIPNGNGPFRRSIDRLLGTTEQVVNNVVRMVRSTIEVITGPL